MKLVLCEDVPKLGNRGDIIQVADGYARNYLLPNKLALVENKENVRQVTYMQKVIEIKRQAEVAEMQKEAEKLDGVSVTVAAKVHEEEKLYGSVTASSIADALKENGIELDKKYIDLEEPIKLLGEYSVNVKFCPEVQKEIKVLVIAE